MKQQTLSLVRKTKSATAQCISPAQLHFSGLCTCVMSVLVILLFAGATARSADTPSLKEAFRDHFYIGTAINRAITTGTGGFRRSPEQLAKDIAQVKEQFNQISPENDLKWALIQPREGAGGYDFGPADAYVDFGVKNHMFIVGHTLVWHNQTPNWVFAGTNTPTENADSPGSFSRAYNGPRASREELLQRMRDHIHTVV